MSVKKVVACKLRGETSISPPQCDGGSVWVECHFDGSAPVSDVTCPSLWVGLVGALVERASGLEDGDIGPDVSVVGGASPARAVPYPAPKHAAGRVREATRGG